MYERTLWFQVFSLPVVYAHDLSLYMHLFLQCCVMSYCHVRVVFSDLVTLILQSALERQVITSKWLL